MTAAGAPALKGFTAEEIAAAWRDALEVWSAGVNLSPPEPYRTREATWPQNEPLAFISLETRQVVVNFDLLEQIGARDSLTAVLAHEIGHHVRFPHALGLIATLRILETRLLPGLPFHLDNLFFDLQVNEVVGRTRSEELLAVYTGFNPKGDSLQPLWFFYLAVYEELWGKPAGTLVPTGQIDAMQSQFPGCRADARMFAQTFYAIPDTTLQFIYFVSRAARYLRDNVVLESGFPLAGDVPEPELDDYDGALHNDAADDAFAEAKRRGWLEGRKTQDDPIQTIDEIARSRPTKDRAAFKQALVSLHYKHLVDGLIFKLPPTAPAPDPSLPTVAQDWEPGDSLHAIDWPLSVTQRGPLAGIQPLKRELEPDASPPIEGSIPAIEIYLDTSGSMPNPIVALNPMTLAAQVLAASTLRKKGIVRAIVYSAGKPKISPWMYSEPVAREFLLFYSGGGTQFPFDTLAAHVTERPEAIRVVISDSDFLSNVSTPEPMELFCRAAERAHRTIALLCLPDGGVGAKKWLARPMRLPRFRLVTVADLQDLPRAATLLADAVLG